MSYSVIRFFLLYLCLAPAFILGASKNRVVASWQKSHSSMPVVVIDAGHGGRDEGAKAKRPFCEEKKITLQTARLVKKYLEQLGYRVIMTRSEDIYLSLSKRVEIAAQAKAEAFISIHFNASKNAEAQGIEIFFCDAKEDRIRTRGSKLLADLVLPRVIRRTSAISRGVKKGNFFVIRETTMPAILVEGGFITHGQEQSLIKSAAYQEKISRGIADGIDAYFRKRGRK